MPKSVTELIAADEAAGTATPADVREAQREATEAAAHVVALQRRVVEGDDQVTAAEIDKAKSDSEFANLRAKAVASKAERTKHAEWLRQCDQLRAEIEGHKPGTGGQLAELLAGAEKAIAAFITAAQERNEAVAGWRQRMQDLRVPHSNPTVPPASQGHIGLADGGQIIAGRRRMEPVNIDGWVVSMLYKIQIPHGTTGGTPRSLRLDQLPSVDTRERLYERLAALDAPAAEPDPNTRFFRHKTSGQVLTYDREPNEIERRGLVEISRKDAWGQ